MSKIGVCVKNLTSGGAEKQAVMLANALVTHHDVEFIIINGEKVHQKYIEMLDSDVTIVKFLGKKNERLSGYRRYVKTSCPDVIFSYLTAANYYSVRASRGTKTKVVTGLRNSRLPLIKHIVDMLLNRYFAVASVSNSFSGKRRFSHTGFKGRKIEVIPNCFHPIDEYCEHNSDTFLKVITVGRFVPQKDYRTAIKTIAKASRRGISIRFIIIGYGELEAQVRTWLKEYQIDGITEIYVNSDNIETILRKSDVYLSTSLYEGLSNSIMEGMNADLPILATKVGDNNILIRHGYNGFLVSKGDSDTLAEYLNWYADHRDALNVGGKASKEILKAHYTKESFAQRYNELITKLLGR